MSSNDININKRKLDKMKYLILELENGNAKTKNLKTGEMVDSIKSIIKSTVDSKVE